MLNVKLSLITKMHQNILLNDHVTIFVLLDKMLRRSPSSHRWAKTRLFVHSTGIKKSCLKTTEKLKIHTLEKEVCLCWSDHLFGKIHYHYLRPLLQIPLRFLLLHFLPRHISSLSLMLHRRSLTHSAQAKSSHNSLKPIILIYQNCTSTQTMQGISPIIQRLESRK